MNPLPTLLPVENKKHTLTAVPIALEGDFQCLNSPRNSILAFRQQFGAFDVALQFGRDPWGNARFFRHRRAFIHRWTTEGLDWVSGLRQKPERRDVGQPREDPT